jgi:hypothetical protein
LSTSRKIGLTETDKTQSVLRQMLLLFTNDETLSPIPYGSRGVAGNSSCNRFPPPPPTSPSPTTFTNWPISVSAEADLGSISKSK